MPAHIPLVLADADIGQIVFVIVALAAGFIQWLIKVMKEKSEAAGRAQPVPAGEDREEGYRAWEEQARPEAPPPVRTEPSYETFEDVMTEVRKAIGQAGPTRTPPPLPQHAPAMTRPLAPAPRMVPIESSTVPVLESAGVKRERHPLTRMLQTPDGYRQAFVLREVLGPPRALHEYRGPED